MFTYLNTRQSLANGAFIYRDTYNNQVFHSPEVTCFAKQLDTEIRLPYGVSLSECFQHWCLKHGIKISVR